MKIIVRLYIDKVSEIFLLKRFLQIGKMSKTKYLEVG